MIVLLRQLKFLHPVMFLFLSVLLLTGCNEPIRKQYQIGAYYYLWFPYNFNRRGYLRKFLDPPQTPVLEVYNSSDPAVAEKHIAWCSRYGIDFLVIDWWPNRPQQNKVLEEGFLRAENIDDIKWCIFYETQSLGMDRATGSIIWTDSKIERFASDLLELSQRYFSHPAYLKVAGRPVIFLYLTRNFSGKTQAAIEEVRSVLRERGVDPFIVADEVFWTVTIDGGEKSTFSGWTEAPQRSRIRLFDAITTYNIYETLKHDHQGYASGSRYLPDVEEIYERYRELCGDEVLFIPNIIPGYNDRALRPGSGHYVIPRQWEEGDASGSLFSELFERLGVAYIDQKIPMMMITSWNEWNEDTAIEPLSQAPPTTRDYSGSGTRLTEGYSYSGFGETYLRIIRDKVVAVAGRVLDKNGDPVSGVMVEGWSGEDKITSDQTDYYGYYRLYRSMMGEGVYEIGILDHEIRRRVSVNNHGSTVQANFIVDR